MTNETVEFTLGGDLDARKNKVHHLDSNPVPRNDRMQFSKPKSFKEIAQETPWKPTIKSGFMMEMPITINPLLAAGHNPSPYPGKDAIANIKKGTTIRDYDIEIGKFKLKYDPSSASFSTNAVLDPIKGKYIPCQIPLIDLVTKTAEIPLTPQGLASTASVLSTTPGLMAIPISGLVMKELGNRLINQGYDPHSTILESITLKGPSAGIGLGMGNDSLFAQTSGKLAALNLRFKHNIDSTQSVYIDCTFSAGLGLGAKIANFETKNRKPGITQEKSVAFGFWDIVVGIENHKANVPTNFPLKTPDLKTLWDQGKTEPFSSLHSSFQPSQSGATMETKHINDLVTKLEAKHEQQFRAILEKQLNLNEKATAIMSYLEEIRRNEEQKKVEAKELEKQAEIQANFYAMERGFALIGHIGQLTNNRAMQQFATGGVALTQGLYGFAQLTGAFGVTALSGAAMITPITAVIGGLLTVMSLFRSGSDKQAKAMFRALQGISKQISNMHQEMRQGFQGIIQYQQVMFKFMNEGFQGIQSRFDDQEVRLDKISNQLYMILAKLQEMDLKSDKAKRHELADLVERFHLINSDSTLAEIFQLIGHQLDSSLTLTNLPDQGNQLSGWFHLKTLKPLFDEPEMRQYYCDLDRVSNYHWIDLPISCAIQMSMTKESDSTNSTIRDLKAKALQKIAKTAEPTAIFMKKISGDGFLNKFLNLYTKKLTAIQKKGSSTLNYIQKHYTKEGMELQFKKWGALNKANSKEDTRDILTQFSRVSGNTIQKLCPLSVSELSKCVNDYNKCIESFRSQAKVIFSLLNLSTSEASAVFRQINSLARIPDRYYHATVDKIERDPKAPNKPWYSFVKINTNNLFKAPCFSDKLVTDLEKSAAKNTESTLFYLEGVSMATRLLDQVINPELPIIMNSKGYSKLNAAIEWNKNKLKELENTLKNLSNSKDTQRLASLRFKFNKVDGPIETAVPEFLATEQHANHVLNRKKNGLAKLGYQKESLSLKMVKDRKWEICGRLPSKATGLIPINVHADCQVQVIFNQEKGLLSTRSQDKTDKGYQTVLEYKLGEDSDIGFTVIAYKKDLPENKKLIATTNARISQLKKIISEQEIKRKKYQDAKNQNLPKVAVNNHLNNHSEKDKNIPRNHLDEPSQTLGKDDNSIRKEQPSNRDTHEYEDDEVMRLLTQSLCSNSQNAVTQVMTLRNQFSAQAIDQVLATHRATIQQASLQQKRIFIPVHQYNGINKSHWTLIILDYTKGHNIPTYYSIDPLGMIEDDSAIALREGLNLPKSTQVIHNPTPYQKDNYNCGPWIVELAAYFAQHGYLPPEADTIDITMKRSEQQAYLRKATKNVYENGYSPTLFAKRQTAPSKEPETQGFNLIP